MNIQMGVELPMLELNPLPVPKQLESLPRKFADEFLSSYEIIQGFVKSTSSYATAQQEALQLIDATIAVINSIIELLAQYEENTELIKGNAKRIDSLYKRFLDLETVQYQLLSANYDQNFLRLKLEKAANKIGVDSRSIAQERKSDDDLQTFLTRFKSTRKQYHSRREKLNRWNEERISGFF